MIFPPIWLTSKPLAVLPAPPSPFFQCFPNTSYPEGSLTSCFLYSQITFRFVETKRKDTAEGCCVPFSQLPNIHILPCPWFIHQNQEIYIGATLFITTQNCRLHTDSKLFSIFPLMTFSGSRIQSRKPHCICHHV